MADFDAIIRAAGGEAHLISPGRRRDLMPGWRRVYASRLHNATGRRVEGLYDWHIFSFNHAPFQEGAQALAIYDRLAISPRIIICPHDDRLPALEIAGAHCLPDFRAYGHDVMIWPEGLAWTMAFTHEDGWFGPYFCRREWVEISVPLTRRIISTPTIPAPDQTLR